MTRFTRSNLTLAATAFAAAFAAVALCGAITAQAGSPATATIDEGPTETLGKAHGFVYRRAVSQSVGNGEARGVVAQCGEERRTAGGGATSGAPLADSGPTAGFSDARSWVGTFTNDPFQDTTFVAAYVVCGNLEGRAVRKTEVGDASPNVELDVRARCPQGTKVTSGGVAYANDSSQSRVMEPFDGDDDDLKPDDGWRVIAYPAGTGGVTAIAICARGRYAYRPAANTAGPFPGDVLVVDQANCRDGEAVTGGGVDMGGASPGGRIYSSYPGDNVEDADEAPDDAWKTTYRLSAGAVAHSIAICKKS